MQGTALWAQGSAWARARLGWLIKHKWLNVGLRGKMGTLVVAGLLGLLTVFTLLAVSTTRQSADRALNERVTLAQMTASKLDASLRQAARLLSVVAQEPALADPDASPAALVEVLRRGRQAMVGLSEGLWLLDETGQPLASVPPSRPG